MTCAIFHSFGIIPCCKLDLKTRCKGLARISDVSLRILGCIPSGPMDLDGFSEFRISKVISSVISMLVKNGSFTCFSIYGTEDKSSEVKTDVKKSFKRSTFSCSDLVYTVSFNFKSGTVDLVFNFEFTYFQYFLLLVFEFSAIFFSNALITFVMVDFAALRCFLYLS